MEPSCAAFALQKTLYDDKEQEPCKANEGVPHSFSVDDLLISVGSLPKASALARQLCVSLASKGFRLTKWINTQWEVLTSQALGSQENLPQQQGITSRRGLSHRVGRTQRLPSSSGL